MRRASVAIAALCLTVIGCSTSDIDPDATVRVSGRALDAAGNPLAGTPVLLFKQADLGEVVLGTVLAIGTLSTVCFLPDPPAVCHQAHTATTDSEGRYELELKGSDTQGTLGTASTLSLVVAGPDARTSTAVTFIAEDPTISLPDTRVWRARPRVSALPDGIGVHWSPLPRGLGGEVEYSVELYDDDTEAAVWSQPASGPDATIDPRLLEDRPASVAVGAGVDLPGSTGAGDVRVLYLSDRLPLEAGEGAPPSRGRPCAAVLGTRPRLAGAEDGCPFTDGDLSTPARLGGDRGTTPTGVALDLGSLRRVDLVVARGFAGNLVVEVSTNGKAWRVVGEGLGTTVTVDPPGRSVARFLRVRSPAGLDESLAAEVSVW
jgi:hypothetical protein